MTIGGVVELFWNVPQRNCGVNCGVNCGSRVCCICGRKELMSREKLRWEDVLQPTKVR
jgi:hypothetical protein